MKKALTVILLICFILAFAACNGSGNNIGDIESSADTQSEVSEDTSFYGYQLAKEDGYGGKTITFLTSYAGDIGWQINPASSPDYNESEATAVNSAVAERTALIEETLKVNIVEIPVVSSKRMGTADSDFLIAVKNDISGGLNEYDVLMPCTRDAAVLAKDGNLLDLYTEAANINPDNVWWSQQFNTDVAIGDCLYFMIGDIGWVNKNATMFVAFNKEMMDDNHLCAEYGYNTMYEMVDDYQWTIDKLFEMSKAVYLDNNQNGKCDTGDQNGLAGQNSLVSWLLFSCGERIATVQSDGYPRLSIYNQRAVKVIEQIQEYTHDNQNGFISANDYFSVSSVPVTDVTVPEFTGGRCLFFMDAVLNMNLIRDMAQDFGIVPMPMYDEAQHQYYSSVSYWSSDTLCLPNSYVSDTDRLSMVSDVVEAMSAASRAIVNDVYYQQTLQNQITRDEESERMLDVIFESRTVELANIYNWGELTSVINNLYNGAIGSFTSSYDAIKDAAQQQIDDTVAIFKKK